MLALCSMLMLPKFVPIILKLCQHNWSKPSRKIGLQGAKYITAKRFIAKGLVASYCTALHTYIIIILAIIQC